MTADDEPKGPINAVDWPEHLLADVVDASGPDRVYGYAVDGDLAPHYSFVETLLLTMSGELPADERSRAVERALVSLVAVEAGDGPARAAQLATLTSGDERSAVVAGTIALAERTRDELDELVPLFAWLDGDRHAALPPCALDERYDCTTIVGDGSSIPFPPKNLGRLPTAIWVFWHAGVRARARIEYLLVMSRLPTIIAQAGHTLARGFTEQPGNTPRLEYQGGGDER